MTVLVIVENMTDSGYRIWQMEAFPLARWAVDSSEKKFEYFLNFEVLQEFQKKILIFTLL